MVTEASGAWSWTVTTSGRLFPWRSKRIEDTTVLVSKSESVPVVPGFALVSCAAAPDGGAVRGVPYPTCRQAPALVRAAYAGCQHFDFGSMKVHCFLDFADVLEAVLEALNSSLLPGLLLLPGGSRARHGKKTRPPGLALLQSRQLLLDQVFKSVFQSLDLLLLGLDIHRQGGEILGLQGNGLKEGSLFCFTILGLFLQFGRVRLGISPTRRGALMAQPDKGRALCLFCLVFPCCMTGATQWMSAVLSRACALSTSVGALDGSAMPRSWCRSSGNFISSWP